VFQIEALTQFRNEAAAVLSPANIVEDKAVLSSYGRDHSFVSGKSPEIAVFPETKEQVQALVKLANRFMIPLTPVSSGSPRFNGDAVPCFGGVVVDFSRMNRVLKIDRKNRYAMVEPGVTFGQLVPQLKKQGMRLVMPLSPPGSKSVLASRLEREPVLIPKYQYDYLDPLLTLEVVYGTGDDFRTGSASGPGTLETLKADKVNPWGPGSIDFFRFVSGAQGTMGLVTWIVTKTEVLPRKQKLYFIPLDDSAALAAPLERLLRQRVVDECLALDNVYLASLLAASRPSDFDELQRNLPAWTIIACVAGYEHRPEERIAIQERYLKEISRDLGLRALSTLPGAQGSEDHLLRLLSEPWAQEPYWKLRRKGSCRDLFFLAPLSRVHELVSLAAGIVSCNRCRDQEMGWYIQPMVQGRGCHCEISLPCDESDQEEMQGLSELFMTISEALAAKGAFFSRPYGPWADLVYRQDGDEVKALRRLKAIFDPNNILNPGKLCFWENSR
jgi:hypothetical protein